MTACHQLTTTRRRMPHNRPTPRASNNTDAGSGTAKACGDREGVPLRSGFTPRRYWLMSLEISAEFSGANSNANGGGPPSSDQSGGPGGVKPKNGGGSPSSGEGVGSGGVKPTNGGGPPSSDQLGGPGGVKPKNDGGSPSSSAEGVGSGGVKPTNGGGPPSSDQVGGPGGVKPTNGGGPPSPDQSGGPGGVKPKSFDPTANPAWNDVAQTNNNSANKAAARTTLGHEQFAFIYSTPIMPINDLAGQHNCLAINHSTARDRKKQALR